MDPTASLRYRKISYLYRKSNSGRPDHGPSLYGDSPFTRNMRIDSNILVCIGETSQKPHYLAEESEGHFTATNFNIDLSECMCNLKKAKYI
jgi:hypothetical protein